MKVVAFIHLHAEAYRGYGAGLLLVQALTRGTTTKNMAFQDLLISPMHPKLEGPLTEPSATSFFPALLESTWFGESK